MWITRTTGFAILATTLVACGLTTNASAQCCACPQCGCPDGCVLREVKRAYCHLEPETKPIKKTFYDTKRVPYCDHKLPPFLHHDCCPQCAKCPKYKTVLVKKEVECGKETTMKCVAEEVTVTVAVPCYRCGHRPRHPILHHLLTEQEEPMNIPQVPYAPEFAADQLSVEPTHVAAVPAAMLTTKDGSDPTVIAVGVAIDEGLIEAPTEEELLRQRLRNEAPVQRGVQR